MKYLNITDKYVAFNQLVNVEKQSYLLRDVVNKAYEKSPGTRDQFDKEIIKLDEKVNIFYMLYSGQLLTVFPDPENENRAWLTPNVAKIDFNNAEYNNFYHNAFGRYYEETNKALESNNWDRPDQIIDSVLMFQKQYSKLLPSPFKAKTEALYEKWQIFEQLFKWYGTFGGILLILLFIRVLNPKFLFKWPVKTLQVLLIILFAFHTLGLGLRWYISGHAPWSDGYEAMVYIAWSLVLAGVLYSRNSPMALAGSSLLASIMLMVAHLSWMDPTITNLVPVLNSYWLTIHVSVITASYGFLGLASLLGLLVLVLMIFANEKNKLSMQRTINELTQINEMALTIGLYMLTIGTFLGGVWANESWGRYWGWDPKETWALISVVIYAFVGHLRLIPKLGSIYLFNLASLLSYGSIMMTFFGVNYYLSGMHSYAKGDPVPIPSFVYYLVVTIAIIASAAYFKRKQVE
jgi:cytochrome c-type biogenesis protein CcsB